MPKSTFERVGRNNSLFYNEMKSNCQSHENLKENDSAEKNQIFFEKFKQPIFDQRKYSGLP